MRSQARSTTTSSGLQSPRQGSLGIVRQLLRVCVNLDPASREDTARYFRLCLRSGLNR